MQTMKSPIQMGEIGAVLQVGKWNYTLQLDHLLELELYQVTLLDEPLHYL